MMFNIFVQKKKNDSWHLSLPNFEIEEFEDF